MAESRPSQPPSRPAAAKSAKPARGGAGFDAQTQEDVVHHVSGRKKRGPKAANMQLNMTSMIDIVFQLLIYFIITASFAQGEGIITAKFPQGTGQAPTEEDPPDRPLRIRITPHGEAGYRLAIDGISAPTNFKELAGTLINLQYAPDQGREGAYKPDNPVVIKPEGLVRWTHVVNAFNAAVKAKYSNVAFAQAKAE